MPSEPEWKKTASKIPDIPIFEDQRLASESEYVPPIAAVEEEPEVPKQEEQEAEVENHPKDFGSDDQEQEEEQISRKESELV